MKPFSRCIAGAAALVMCASLSFPNAAQAQRRAAADEGGVAGAGIPLMTTERVASGLVRPIYATYAPGDATRLFIIEKQGIIRILKIDTNPPTLLATPFLNIDPIIQGGTSTNSEQGLLGLAFHPNYQQNGYFFVYYTATSPLNANTVARYQVSASPDVANAASGTVLLSQPDTETNHNGGWIDFKPGDTEGYLYVAIGDGGGSNDNHGTFGNGQNINTLFGKMLRIDIDGADNIPGNGDDDTIASTSRNYSIPADNPFARDIPGEDEIWAYGLRNPWRNSFDRFTGDLYIADVGQFAWEEVNVEPSSSTGGLNYGWRCMEGNNCTGLTGCTCNVSCGAGLLVCPVQQYSHSVGCAITGGYVYRGSRMPQLQGTYFYADFFCSAGVSPIFTFQYTGTPFPTVTNRTAELAPAAGLSITSITSFGEDWAGEIYICDQNGGEIFKIVPRPCMADIVPDGTRDVSDLLLVITSWGACPAPPAACPADIIADGIVDVSDLLSVITNWGDCP